MIEFLAVFMSIPALDAYYPQVANSELIQTTIYKIISIINRTFINPSELCLLGHTLTISFLSCFDITPGGLISYYILFELIFLTIQEARQLYHSLTKIFTRY